MTKLREVMESSLKSLRVVSLVAVLALVGLIAWERSSHEEHGVPLVSAEEVDLYIEVALDVRHGRHAARVAGWHPTMWYRWPQVSEALDRAGWDMPEYVRIESLIATAFLAIDSPIQFGTNYPPGSAPPATREVVKARLADVRKVQAPLQD